MRTRFTNCRVVDARGERRCDVFIENGAISADVQSPADVTYDLAGRVLMSAFTDTHCHLRDPGYPDKETMETGMRAAVRGGYATLCAMANTMPVCDTAERVAANLRRAEELGLCRLVQAGAAGVGLSDEIPADRRAISGVTRVVSNDGKTILNDEFMRGLLCDSKRYGFIVSTHCQPERATVRRDLRLLAQTGGALHVGHISRAETAAMIREAKAAGLPVTCEVMPHHIFAWDDDYRVNPPIRTHEDVEALIEAVLDGTVDCLATDHAPHTEADKRAGAAGISNIEHAAAIFHTVLCLGHGMSLPALSRLMSANPARLLGTGTGLVEPGERADLVVFDPQEEWTIRKEDMISRSHNTPFEGRRVKGRVKMTFVKGELLYDDGRAI